MSLRRANLSIERLIIVVLLASAAIIVIAYVVLFIGVVSASYIIGLPVSLPRLDFTDTFVAAIFFPLYKNHAAILGEWGVSTVYGVFVWSTLMGILWLVAFSFSIVIANISVKLTPVGRILDERLHVQTRPFRILQLLAIVLVLICCAISHLV
jgi:hypothetical protein